MLCRVVPPAGSAQWRPGGHGTPDPPGRLGGDPQIAPVRRALRKVSTSGRRIAGARWQPECQARHREDDGVCSGDGQVPAAGRCCRIADVAGSRGMCRLDARPGISGYRADGTARRAPATLSPPAEAVTAVDIPPSHENFLIVLGAVPRSAPRCKGLTAPCRRIGRMSLVRVLSWWSLPVWARGRQITPEAPPIPPRRGTEGPRPPVRCVRLLVEAGCGQAPGPAGRGPVQIRHCTHRGDLLLPEGARRAPSLACLALWRSLDGG